MTTAIPQPPRSSSGPPTMALPALPVAKTRKPSGLQTPSTSTRSLTTTPKTSGLRAPSSSLFPPPTTPAPASALPQPRSLSATVNGTSRTLRKSVSINSFPQPPRGDNRVLSVPPSPLSSARKPKTNNSATLHTSGTPSLLNGSGDGKSVGKGGTRFSDGLISVSSLPQSRSSSAQDSYSTSATTYDDNDGPKSSADVASKRQSKNDSKGNVLVSVRVRPDAGGQDQRSDGEWSVDGRKSLIAYGGKEGGGDYYYGMASPCIGDVGPYIDHLIPQITYSLQTTTIRKSTTTSRSD